MSTEFAALDAALNQAHIAAECFSVDPAKYTAQFSAISAAVGAAEQYPFFTTDVYAVIATDDSPQQAAQCSAFSESVFQPEYPAVESANCAAVC